MLLKVARLVGVSITGMALANSAWAQETNAVNVTTGSDSARLGAEFRSELIYDDHGLLKVKGYDPKATTGLKLSTLNLKLKGNLNANTEYAFRLNPLGGNAHLDYGYATHWLTKMVGFSFGRMKLLQGGFDHIDGNYRTHVEGTAAHLLPFAEYQDMAALHIMAAGKITLQVFNDQTTATGGNWNETAHPTWSLGWRGEFGPIQPLLNIGSYDNNKSSWVDVGVKAEMAGLTASLDYYMLQASDKVPDGTKFKSEVNQGNSFALNAAYEIRNVAMPWLHFSMSDMKQHTTNLKFNSIGNTTGVNAQGDEVALPPAQHQPRMDDNAMHWGVGADLLSMGNGFTPFVALVGESGKYADVSTADPNDTETRSQLMIKLGVLGEI